MAQAGKCPHFDVSAQKCNLLRELQNRGSNASQMYMVMGVEKADWRASFCSTSQWTECGVYCNEQKGVHR